ncbi:MAG: DUF433 domain-containing protein, partial [Candidatus Binatia bacterium]
METESETASTTQQTEHPYIVRVAGICGGRPIIKGTRISVRHIAERYRAGDTVEEILQGYPHLQGAAVFDALRICYEITAITNELFLIHRAEWNSSIRHEKHGGAVGLGRVAH